MMTPADYLSLFASATVTTDKLKLRELDYICRVALTNEPVYKLVENATKIPWALVAALHFREGNQNFTRHLHNGDPLAARTVHVPAGRPLSGEPPFSWPESATDALSGRWLPPSWDVPGALEFCERYNGLGYQKRGANSPYLWDYTSKYVSGLFVADGSFDAGKIECRPGVVAILKTLGAKGVPLDFTALDSDGSLLH